MEPQVLTISTLEGTDEINPRATYGKDYICVKLGDQPHTIKLAQPYRVHGILMFLLTEGTIDCLIDNNSFSIQANSFVTINYQTWEILQRGWHGAKGYFAYFTSEFLHDLNIDLGAINIRSMIESEPSPVIPDLKPVEVEVMKMYIDLLFINASYPQDTPLVRNIARSLVQAILYNSIQIFSQRQRLGESAHPMSRQKQYVQDFIQLLQVHFMNQRSIEFYADKLCISGKYLSHIIKEATGRSASEWIAQFVVSEAKNMLRFSNKNVQQVAYELNFTTQSSFGKYFKHVTGMSPTEFLKS